MGKVHGGLARAGKVKSNTRKVEKVEKTKPVTGRAKKRMLYNRRFVSKVESFGRRGPNSNQARLEAEALKKELLEQQRLRKEAEKSAAA
jgi:small subunit ribosomal protein S30e